MTAEAPRIAISLELVTTIFFIVLIVIGFKVLPLYQSLYLVPGI